MARNFDIVDKKHLIYQYHFFYAVHNRKMYIVFIVIEYIYPLQNIQLYNNNSINGFKFEIEYI